MRSDREFGGVPPSLPVAPPQGLRPHPPLRLPRQPLALHAAAAVLRSTQHRSIAERATNFHRQGIATSLALPQVWWADGGHRTTYGGSTPTPFSADLAHDCGLKRLTHNSKIPHGSPRSAPVRLAPNPTPTSRPLSHRPPSSIPVEDPQRRKNCSRFLTYLGP
jgi:hypothetical protein